MKAYSITRSILLPCLTALILLNSNHVAAQIQPPSIIWQKPLGGNKAEEARHLQLTPDGGCIFTGFSRSTDGDVTENKGDDDLWVVKLDANGAIQWQKTFGGSGQEWGRHIQLTADGGYIIAGHNTTLNDLADVQGNNGGFDYWVLKLSSTGALEWQKSLGGSSLDLGYRVQQTPNGNYIVFGGIKSSDGDVIGKTGTDADYWLVMLDANGNEMWQKVIGGTKHEEGSSIELTSDSGFIISGYSNSTNGDVSGNHGDYDAYIVKTDGLGNIEWSKSYGGTSDDAARDARQTTDGGYIFAGYTNSIDGDVTGKHDAQDLWVVKLNANGTIQWQKALGGSSLEYAYNIEQAPDNSGYLVIGHTGSTNGDVTGTHGMYDCWVLKLDLNGNLLWQKTLGGSDQDYGRAFTQTSTGDYFVAGYTSSTNGDVVGKHGGSDAWILKLAGNCIQQPFFADTDDDGFGNAAITIQACEAPLGYVSNNTDCNDGNSNIHPNATELCNTIDDDCDTQTDEGLLLSFFADADGDGFGNAAITTQSCEAPLGYVSNNTDCNDGNSNIHPNAIELCNTIDDDCDTQTDEGLLLSFFADADGDGFGNAAITTQSCEAPLGYVSNNTDCNDGNNNIHPNAPELCNTIDDDCDTQTDEGLLLSFFADADGDGFGNAAITTQSCEAPLGYVSNNTDCNDGNNNILPNATELCNTVDDDCDTETDEGLLLTFYADADGDGFGNAAIATQACEAPLGYVSSNTDCNDGNNNIHPNATELCNTVDDDCDTQTDEGLLLAFFADADSDGFGNPNEVIQSCEASDGYVSDSSDCNDDPLFGSEIHPGTIEICNGIDDNCNDTIDEGVSVICYVDSDNDGFGNPDSAIMAGCTVPSGYSPDNTDCDDQNPAIHSPVTYYADTDLDGYGDPDSQITVCSLNDPDGFVSNHADCNDDITSGGAAIHPLAAEDCNSVDDNCDGNIDEGAGQQTFYEDADGDGYGNQNIMTEACLPPTGYVTNNFDCDDASASINPAALPTKYWDLRYGGNNHDQLNTLIKTSDGGYLLGGRSKSPADLDKTDPNRDVTNATYDYWIVKTDADGAKKWDKTYGGTGEESSVKLLQLTDGGYLIGGCSYSGIGGDKTEDSKGLSDYWILRIGATGSIIWDKTIGGSGEDQFQAMQQMADGNFLLSGNSASGISGDRTEASQGMNDYWIVKIDASGNYIWDKRFGGSKDDIPTEMRSTPDGGFLLGGRSYSPADGNKTQSNYDVTLVTSDYWVVKIDANGDYSWDKCYGGTSDDFLFAIQHHNNGNYILGGHSKSPVSGDKTMNSEGGKDYWVVNIDGSGNKLSDFQYGGSDDDEAYLLEITPDGGFIIAGNSPSGISGDKTQDSQGSKDYWMVKASATGSKQWDLRHGGNNIDVPTSLQLTADGGYILAGYSQSGISGDKTQDNYDASLATRDYWVVKLNGSCGYQSFYADADNDGYGNPASSVLACTAPGGYLSNSTDCNDANASIHPGASDICNGIDDNCNGVIDENAITATITPAGSVTTCSGVSLTLTANSGAGITYQWLKNNANIAGATNSTYSTSKAGSYSVSVVNSFGCSAVSSTTVISVASSPSATVTPLGSLDICATGSVVLQANTGTGLTYQWMKGSNNVAGATNQTYMATKAATYKVIVTNSSGCSKTSAGAVVTKSCKESASAEKVIDSKFSLYPNPTGGRFIINLTIDAAENEMATIEVVDAIGQIVHIEKASTEKGLLIKEVTLSHSLSNGMYWVRVMTEHKIYSSQIVYQK